MGFFSWLGKKAANFADAVFDVVDAVTEVATDAYKDFTGQSKYEEADRLYNDVMERFEKHKAMFEKEVSAKTESINKHVQSINKAKVEIKTELFPKFAEKMKRLKDVTVSQDFLKECEYTSSLKVDSVKARSELFLIDFDKHPFKTNALAIVTLGFYTRKKAKETLLKVKEEVKRIEEEMERMNSELIRIQRIEEAIKQIDSYYTSLIAIYNAMLYRLDNSVNFLLIKCINKCRVFTSSEMSIRGLPISQQKEIQAIVTITKIMKSIVDTQLTINGEYTPVENANREFKKQSEEINLLAA